MLIGDTDDSTSTRFELEFDAFSDNDADLSPPEMEEYYFFSRTGIEPQLYAHLPGDPYRTELPPDAYKADGSFLKGKRVLDAGCGPGRFLSVVARSDASHIVGLEMGNHVERAAARLAGTNNVDLVQGSVLEPPFLPGCFDYVYSIGVLHHTPDPPKATEELGRLVRPNGAMSVWVYPHEYWGGAVRKVIGRGVHAVLSRLSPRFSLWIVKRVLYPIGRLQMRLARRRWTKILTAPLFALSIPRHPQRETMMATIYDYYCPPIITTHGYREVERWLADAGFTEVQSLPVPTSCLARRKDAMQ